MIATGVLTALALTASPLEAPESSPENDAFALKGEARLSTGAFAGRSVRRDVGAMIAPELDLTPTMKLSDALRLELPAVVKYRGTLGAALSELYGKLGLGAQWAPSPGWKLEGGVAVAGYYRPGWLDLYQPLTSGTYAPTDRFSHWDPQLQLKSAWRPSRRHHLRAKYRLGSSNYVVDPAYDPVNAPMHLTPESGLRQDAELGWRYVEADWKVGASVQAFQQNAYFLYSRDALTGRTHAGAGGPPPNPLQVLRGVEPALEGELELGERVELSGQFGLELVSDAYQGYYSFGGLHPELKAKVNLGVGVLSATAEAWLRRYGESSYSAGSGRPALLWGDRREDRRLALGGEWRQKLHGSLDLVAEAKWITRATNFPSYQPFVYPASREYDIEWSYSNLEATVGVAWTFGE